MGLYELTKEQIIPQNILSVFNFFSKPENLSKITPKRLDFKILTPQPIEMKEGIIIDYKIKIMALPIKWTTLITKYDPPNIFIDEQVRGPYSAWHHTHTFTKINDNKTLIKDIVFYSVPYGFIGNSVHSLYIKRDLENIFSYRKKIINKIFNN